MKIIVDKSIADLGKKTIVLAIAKHVNPSASLSENFLAKQKEMEEWALQCDAEEALKHPVNQGYVDSISAVGRSTKKNPPTAVALIQNIKRRGSIPHINSIVDIYNVESLRSFLAIGGHDYDKIDEEICFTVSKKEDVFYPILAPEKYVAETDYVYKDKKGIMAWIDVRDGENFYYSGKCQYFRCNAFGSIGENSERHGRVYAGDGVPKLCSRRRKRCGNLRHPAFFLASYSVSLKDV